MSQRTTVDFSTPWRYKLGKTVAFKIPSSEACVLGSGLPMLHSATTTTDQVDQRKGIVPQCIVVVQCA